MDELAPGQYWQGMKRDGHNNRRICRIVGRLDGKLAVQVIRESALSFDRIKLVTEAWVWKWIAEQQACESGSYSPCYTEEEIRSRL